MFYYPAGAVGSYSSGPPAGGTPPNLSQQNLVPDHQGHAVQRKSCAKTLLNSVTYQSALRGDCGRPDVPLQYHPIPGSRAQHVPVPSERAYARRVTLEAVDPLAGCNVPDLRERKALWSKTIEYYDWISNIERQQQCVCWVHWLQLQTGRQFKDQLLGCSDNSCLNSANNIFHSSIVQTRPKILFPWERFQPAGTWQTNLAGVGTHYFKILPRLPFSFSFSDCFNFPNAIPHKIPSKYDSHKSTTAFNLSIITTIKHQHDVLHNL